VKNKLIAKITLVYPAVSASYFPSPPMAQIEYPQGARNCLVCRNSLRG